MLRRKRPQWEKTFRLRSSHGAAKGALALLFWIWGLAGLVFNAAAVLGLTGSAGPVTPAHLAATCLVWIGGMILFGVGAMLTYSDFDGERPILDDYGDVRVTE